MDGDATRGRTLLEESREAVVVLDDTDRVIGASRRARQSIDGLREGERIPAGLLSGDAGIIPLVVPYDVGGRRERLVYLSRSGDLTAYEELRTGFTAAGLAVVELAAAGALAAGVWAANSEAVANAIVIRVVFIFFLPRGLTARLQLHLAAGRPKTR